jgi:hypothetical protein
LTEKVENLENLEQAKRANMMAFDKMEFAKLIVNNLNRNVHGRRLLKKYNQEEVREIIEHYRVEKNQWKLREISQILYAKSPEYQRLIRYFAEMSLFAHVIAPIKDITKGSKAKVLKQYSDIGELVRKMNIRHEMQKVLKTAFCEDIFYGYVFNDKKSFYIQKIDGEICRITSIEDGVYNFSIDMNYFAKDERRLIGFADEVKTKYIAWKAKWGEQKGDPQVQLWNWVELDKKNTMCIKVNEEMLEVFPPFAGSFDAIFDIQAYKELRKSKEEIGNYMILTQELPIRKDSDNNNDFMIDMDMFRYFHNMAVESVPDNVGVITSPMPIQPVNFQRDTGESDGVAKATRDYWSGNGTSQLLFNTDTSTSQGLLMSIKTDEEIVFGVLTQIQRWLNRYLSYQFSGDLMFNVDILHITHFNRQEMFEMYLQAGQYGVPIKSHLCATVGLDPIETMNMAFLENDLLKLHEEFVPLFSSNTMSVQLGEDGKIAPTPQPVPTQPTGGSSGKSAPKDPTANPKGGRPQATTSKQSDETARGKDKPNGN